MANQEVIEELQYKKGTLIKSMQEREYEVYSKAIEALENQKTGHWFIDERPESDREIICSNCEQPIFKYHKLDFDYRPKFCPNCGAKMKGE